MAFGTAPAFADPTPNAGPAAGGTTVTDAAPQLTFTSLATTVGGSNVMAAIASDGNVYEWGPYIYNSLTLTPPLTGDLPASSTLAPVLVQFADPQPTLPFVSVAVANSTVIAADSAGTMYAWGLSGGGLTGSVPPPPPAVVSIYTLIPQIVPLPAGVTAKSVAAGQNAAYAIGSDGKVYAWGLNNVGQLGNGTTAPTSVITATPGAVDFSAYPGALPIKSVTVNTQSVLAVGADGNVYGWGSNGTGQLGDGTTSDRSAPVLAALPSAAVPVASVALNVSTGYAIGADGNVYAWGGNGTTNGVLGNGTTAGSLTPVTVSLPAAALPAKQVAGGRASGSVIGADGNVYSWGNIGNSIPMLGNGTAAGSSTPVAALLGPTASPGVSVTATPVPAPAGGVTPQRIVGSTNNIWLIGADGDVYSWGAGLFLGSDLSAVSDGSPIAPNLTYGWPATPPRAQITAVTFGGVAGTNLVETPNWNVFGTFYQYSTSARWSVNTPPACGVVDVAVTYTYGGASHTDTYPNGFTFGSAPAITTQPSSATVAYGGTYTTSVTATGDATPAVQWQSSTDGTNWTNVAGATSATLTVTNATTSAQYRAVASNCWGAAYNAISGVATLDVLVTDRTVDFDSAGGSAVSSQTVVDGGTATKPADPTRSGFTFLGWFAPGASTPFTFTTPITGDLTLTARWSAVTPPVPVPGNAIWMLALMGTLLMALGARKVRR